MRSPEEALRPNAVRRLKQVYYFSGNDGDGHVVPYDLLVSPCPKSGLIDRPGCDSSLGCKTVVLSTELGSSTMTPFQKHAVLLIAIWLLMVVVRFRRSKLVLIGGLFGVGLYTLIALVRNDVSMQKIGLSIPASRLSTIGFAVAWLGLMLAYSPLADSVATRWVDKPPTLDAFRVLQQSKAKLFLGIVAWVLGGFLEELAFRGIIVSSMEALALPWLAKPVATAIAVGTAAAGAGLIHSYQGLRAVIIVAQLSVLFGVLFVVSRHNLWAVVLCHGLYDTAAFIRFANKTSKYSNIDPDS